MTRRDVFYPIDVKNIKCTVLELLKNHMRIVSLISKIKMKVSHVLPSTLEKSEHRRKGGYFLSTWRKPPRWWCRSHSLEKRWNPLVLHIEVHRYNNSFYSLITSYVVNLSEHWNVDIPTSRYSHSLLYFQCGLGGNALFLYFGFIWEKSQCNLHVFVQRQRSQNVCPSLVLWAFEPSFSLCCSREHFCLSWAGEFRFIHTIGKTCFWKWNLSSPFVFWCLFVSCIS